jgi:hypothetical protein
MDVDNDTIVEPTTLDRLLTTSSHPIELALTGKGFDYLVNHGQMR